MEKQIISTISDNKTMRKSGIELLRIFAAVSVIVLHYNTQGAFASVQSGSLNKLILYIAESVCICAVDIFILVSGYFLAKTNKRSVGKIIELVLQVIIFRLLYYFAAVVFGREEFSIKVVLIKLVPNNYYIILYAALYFISPYINILFEKLSSQGRRKYIITMLVLFSLWPVCRDLSGELLSKEWFGLSTISAWGNSRGFNITNFALIYSLGAYLRYEGIPKWLNKAQNTVFCVVGCVFIILLWSIANDFTHINGLRSAWVYHNPFVILLTVSLFALFKKIKLESRIVNDLAKASFVCFLVHGYFLPFIKIKFFVNQPFYIMILHIVICVIGIYAISWIAYKAYTFLLGSFINRIDKVIVPDVEKNA